MQSNFLKNLIEDGGFLVNIANVLIIFLMTISYPLPAYALRKGIESLFMKDPENVPMWVSILISSVVILSTLIMGLFLKSIDNILDFTSSLFGGISGLILPPLFLWKVGQMDNIKWYRVAGVVFFCIGVTITCLGFGIAIYKWLIEPFL